MSNHDRKWLRNNLEVIINHYRELEEEIRMVRESYETELKLLEMSEDDV